MIRRISNRYHNAAEIRVGRLHVRVINWRWRYATSDWSFVIWWGERRVMMIKR